MPFGFDWRQPPLASIPDLAALARRVRGLEVDGVGRTTLGRHHPTIVFRYVSSNDNSRTLIAGALPAAGVLPNKGYVHAVDAPQADAVDVLAFLGLLNSIPCDWWARRFVDTKVTAGVIDGLRVPVWTPDERRAVARCVADLLDDDLRELAGGIDVDAIRASTPSLGNDEHSALSVDLAAFRGYGLDANDARVILGDFTHAAVSLDYRAQLLEGLKT
jgi:hypothetical protein